MNNPALAAVLSVLLLCSGPAASGSPEDVLKRVREIYDAIDANKDGKVMLTEATAAGISAVDFAKLDSDRSAFLDAGEFVVYYRQLLIRAGSKVPAELDTEIRRIAAVKKAAAEKAAAAKEAAEKAAAKKAAAEKAAAEQAAASKAQAEREAAEKAEVAAQGAEPKNADDKKELNQNSGQAKPAGEKAARPQGEASGKEAADSPAAGQQGNRGGDIDPMKGIIGRLVLDGLLSDREGRTLLTALVNPVSPRGPAKEAKQIRSTIAKVRNQLIPLVKEGKLTEEEAGHLSHAFDERAKAKAPSRAKPKDKEQAATPSVAANTPGKAAVNQPMLDPDSDPSPNSEPDTEQGDSKELLTPREARRIIQRLVRNGSIPAEEGRSMSQGVTAITKDFNEISLLSRVGKVVTDSSARVEVLMKTGKLKTDEGQQLLALYTRRSSQVRKALRAAGAPVDVVNASQGDSADKAQRHVRRLINEGRVSAAEGRLMFQAMAKVESMVGDLTQLRGMRDALAAVRPRIGELVRQGHLTAEEGRELSGVFDARATSAAAALAEIENEGPKTGVRDPEPTGKQPAPKRDSVDKKKTPSTRKRGGA